MDLAKIERIAVVGAGLMGHGIAQEFAVAGFQVRLHDQGDESLGRAIRQIRDNYQRLTSLGLLEPGVGESALGRITACPRLADAVSDAEVVIEAIFEDLDLKHRLYRSLNDLCPAESIIASNTSSFVPSRLAEAVRQPERMLVAHYFNPPYLLPLVEVVPAPTTADETVTTMVALLKQVGKHPVVLRNEATGFVGNRLQFALFREALAIVEQGIADPEAVDEVVRYGFGRRLAAAGPFEIFDLGGLDTILAVASQILPDVVSGSASMPAVPDLLRQKVERGDLGVKSGKGFHEWTPEAAEELRTRLNRGLALALAKADSSR